MGNMGGDPYGFTDILTEGYHSLRLTIDVTETGLSNAECCYLQYTTPSTSIQYEPLLCHDGTINKQITIPDNSDYNNQKAFTLTIGVSGNSPNRHCYFDNLIFYGIPYTSNPTTKPTPFPTTNTLNPSNIPTSKPSDSPSTNPSKNPSSDPSQSPSSNPSFYPSSEPTSMPTMIPSLFPSL